MKPDKKYLKVVNKEQKSFYTGNIETTTLGRSFSPFKSAKKSGSSDQGPVQ